MTSFKNMRRITLKMIIQTYKVILLWLCVFVLAYYWCGKTNEVKRFDETSFYIDPDSNLLEAVAKDYLRIHSPNKCKCRESSYIELQRANYHNYDVYRVSSSNGL